jgi:hypothetical protein
VSPLNGVAKRTSVTNIGGGVKLSLFGPVRLRLGLPDLQSARGPLETRPSGLYAGLNMSF